MYNLRKLFKHNVLSKKTEVNLWFAFCDNREKINVAANCSNLAIKTQNMKESSKMNLNGNPPKRDSLSYDLLFHALNVRQPSNTLSADFIFSPEPLRYFIKCKSNG